MRKSTSEDKKAAPMDIGQQLCVNSIERVPGGVELISHPDKSFIEIVKY